MNNGIIRKSHNLRESVNLTVTIKIFYSGQEGSSIILLIHTIVEPSPLSKVLIFVDKDPPERAELYCCHSFNLSEGSGNSRYLLFHGIALY